MDRVWKKGEGGGLRWRGDKRRLSGIKWPQIAQSRGSRGGKGRDYCIDMG